MFDSKTDACTKLQCENKTEDQELFFVAKGTVFGNGITLYKNNTLTIPIDDGIYIMGTQIFSTLNGVVTFETCVPDTDPCSLTVSWDNTKTTAVCNSNSITKTVAVSGNQGFMIQFSLDGSTWTDANIGTNTFTFIDSLTDQCTSVFYRVKDCPTITEWGCVQKICSPVTIECSTTEANPHACNITNGTHHGYFDVATNQAVGIFASNQGEYKFESVGVWKPTTFIGTSTDGLRYVGYKEPYQNSVIWTRTKAGCPEFYDGHCNDPRTVTVVTDNTSFKRNLNITNDSTGSVINFDALSLSSHIAQGQGGWQVYFKFGLLNAPANLKINFNNQGWLNSTVSSNLTYFDLSTGGVPKDNIFYLSTDNGVTKEKFVIRAWSQGGHFSLTHTITRVRDGKVWVYTFIGNEKVKSYIRLNNGTVVNGNSTINNSFILPSVLTADQTVMFGFTDSNLDWLNIRLLNVNN